MGASWFEDEGVGDTVLKAFKDAVEEARYQHGHGGYTGTVAEKESYIVVDLPDGWNLPEFDLAWYVETKLPKVDDKYGPAAAVKHPDKENTWIFFGYASS